MDTFEFIMTNGPLIFFAIIWLIVLGGILLRIIRSFTGKTIKTKAKVFDKYISENTVYDHINRRGTTKKTYYTVCFDIDGKIKKFNVSSMAYDYFKKGMDGILIYKDNNYIDFNAD